MAETTKQLAVMQKQIASLEKRVVDLEKNKSKPKTVRQPSAYNKFMSTEGSKLKKKNPELSQPDIMREVAKLWRIKNDK